MSGSFDVKIVAKACIELTELVSELVELVGGLNERVEKLEEKEDGSS